MHSEEAFYRGGADKDLVAMPASLQYECSSTWFDEGSETDASVNSKLTGEDLDVLFYQNKVTTTVAL